MYEGIALKLLTNANLSPDWMAIFVGHRGIELGPFNTVTLSFADVQAFAVDQLAVVAGTPDEWDVFRIADAESLYYDVGVEDVFRSLAERTGLSVNHALRKWRYAVIAHDLPRIERAGEDRAIPPYGAWDDVWTVRGDHIHNLIHEWGAVCPENPPPEIGLDWYEEPVRKNFAVVKAWLLTEYEALVANV